MHFSSWSWFVTVTPVPSQVTVAGQSVHDLKTTPFVRPAGEFVCPLAQVIHARSQTVVPAPVLVPDLHLQTPVSVNLHRNGKKINVKPKEC